MSFINIPKFYIPQQVRILVTDEEIQTHTHPLQTCPQCHYVLCSCGACHSEECQEMCSYDDSIEA